MRIRRYLGHIILMFLVVLAIAFSSCGTGDTIWTRSIDLPKSTWDADNKLVFEPDSDKVIMNDATKLVLFVKYKENANLRTLPLVVETESAVDGFEYSLDSVRIELFDSIGVPTGRGNYGIYERADTFNLRYPIVAGWTLTARPAVMAESAEGIVAFGIALLK